MHALVLAGACGVGKSALLRRVRAACGPPVIEEAGLLCWEHYPARRLLLLGRYRDDEVYPGCDRLAADAVDWLRLLLRDGTALGYGASTLVWEMPFGTDARTLAVARAHAHVRCVLLTASVETLEARRVARGQEMPTRDWRRREARVARFVARESPETWPQETDADRATNAARLLAMLED